MKRHTITPPRTRGLGRTISPLQYGGRIRGREMMIACRYTYGRESSNAQSFTMRAPPPADLVRLGFYHPVTTKRQSPLHMDGLQPANAAVHVD